MVSVKLEPADDDENVGPSPIAEHGGGDGDQKPLIPTTTRTTIRAYLNWRERALGKTKSVVQTLLNRQLGLPFSYRSDDTASNSLSEMVIGRQLVSQRARSVDDEDRGIIKSIVPSMVTVNQNRTGEKIAKPKLEDWVQLDIEKIEETELTIVDTKLWTRTKEGQGRNGKFVETFYALDTSNFEFTLVSRLHSIGKLKKTALLNSRIMPFCPGATGYTILTLMGPCHLRAYDISKGKVTAELKLNLDITTPPLKAYTEMDVSPSTAEIFVMGTAERKLLKVILILDYPPNWTKVGMIFIDELPLKLSLRHGLCYITQNKNVHLTTWPFVMARVTESIPATGKSPAESLTVRFEGRLREMPELINTIPVEMYYQGLIDMEVPLIFGASKMGMNFYRSVPCDNGFPPKPVYEFNNMGIPYKEDSVDVFQFPDYSPRVLICTQVTQQYEVVTFKAERVGDTNDKILKSSISHPFNYCDELKIKRNVEPPPSPSSSTSGRPKATEKTSILGITYSGLLDIIAVLMADEEEFMVVLYEPLKLTVFKALPPVRAWPPGSDDGPNPKQDDIHSVHFSVEPEFVFVHFEYSNECWPSKEVFCFRLMAESSI